MAHNLLNIPSDLVGAQSYSCASCHEAFLVKVDPDDASALRFTLWQARHGQDCRRPPLGIITPSDLVILALLNAPSH